MRLKSSHLGILLFIAILILVIGVRLLIQNPVEVVQPIHFEPTVLVPASQEPPINAAEEYERLKALKYGEAQQNSPIYTPPPLSPKSSAPQYEPPSYESPTGVSNRQVYLGEARTEQMLADCCMENAKRYLFEAKVIEDLIDDPFYRDDYEHYISEAQVALDWYVYHLERANEYLALAYAEP